MKNYATKIAVLGIMGCCAAGAGAVPAHIDNVTIPVDTTLAADSGRVNCTWVGRSNNMNTLSVGTTELGVVTCTNETGADVSLYLGGSPSSTDRYGRVRLQNGERGPENDMDGILITPNGANLRGVDATESESAAPLALTKNETTDLRLILANVGGPAGVGKPGVYSGIVELVVWSK